MTVDLMLRDEKRGYQDENWKARMEERVSGGKTVTGETGAGIIDPKLLSIKVDAA